MFYGNGKSIVAFIKNLNLLAILMGFTERLSFKVII